MAPTAVSIDYERLRTLSRAVDIRDVRLLGAQFVSLREPEYIETNNGDLQFGMSLVDARWARAGNTFDVLLSYQVLTRLGDDLLFRATSSWVVKYQIASDFIETADFQAVADDFVMANGQVNLFPYLRQFVSDVTTRAGWPTLLLPVFKAPANRPPELVKVAGPLFT